MSDPQLKRKADMFKYQNMISGIGIAALMGATMALPAHADEIWKINYARSHFGPSANTLVLQRVNSGGNTSLGVSARGSFLVISGGKIYMAVDEQALASDPAVRKVDYTRWRDMKLVEIGDHIRSGYCDFRCQSGFSNNEVTLTFVAHGNDPTDTMQNMIAVNAR
jgi:hypothetical protein